MFRELDPLLHSQLRLAIISLLVGLDEADFVYLKEKTEATAGNLSVQIDKLSQAGYIEVEKGLERIAANSDREVNRLDLEGLDLHRKVRQGYLSLLEKEGERIVKIDASLPLNQVVENTKQVLFDRMGPTE